MNDEQLAALEDLGIKYEVMVPDVQVMLDEMAKGYVNEVQNEERRGEEKRRGC